MVFSVFHRVLCFQFLTDVLKNIGMKFVPCAEASADDPVSQDNRTVIYVGIWHIASGLLQVAWRLNTSNHLVPPLHGKYMREKWKQWPILFSWAPKSLGTVTVATKLEDAYLPLGRKALINLDRVLKSRDITLPTKVQIVKSMVFPVVMHRCESWTIKKAEHWRTDAFELC